MLEEEEARAKATNSTTTTTTVVGSSSNTAHFFSRVYAQSSDVMLPSFLLAPRRELHLSRPLHEGGESRVHIPSSISLTIGDVVVPIPDYTLHPERVAWTPPGIDHALEPLLKAAAAATSTSALSPSEASALALRQENMFFSLRDPVTRSHLRWLCQKEALGQDMCLIGDPGPAMRWLVQLYSFLTRREVRVVYLNRDVTESDLKQRREIRNGTLIYEDQSAVTAAKMGQLLVLEGLERVERNVLPVINNLLENREMHLDNGSVLIHPARYDSLLRDLVREKMRKLRVSEEQAQKDSYEMRQCVEDAKQELELMGLIRVSENFRVIGITVPVPPYEGNPLDPPLRSRFQCLYVRTPLPAVPTTSSDITALHLSGNMPKPKEKSKETIALEKAQDQRMEAMTRLRVSIDTINAATKDFQSSKAVGGGGGGEGDNEASAAVASAATSSIQNIGNYELGGVLKQIATFPDLPVGEALLRGFPWHLYARQLPGGGNANTSVGAEEVRRRFTQYVEVLDRCSLSLPYLLTPPHEPQPPAAEQQQRKSPTSPNRPRSPSGQTAAQQATAALRSVITSVTGGASQTEQSVRAYITSGKLVGQTAGKHASAVLPVGVAQSCNYIQEIRNIRSYRYMTSEGKGEASAASANQQGNPYVVVADSVVATSTHNETSATRGAGTFTLPIFMGNNAVPARGAKGTQDKLVVAEQCPSPHAIFTTSHYHVLQSMLQLHASRQHIALIGPTGCGKTALVREFAELLGYETETTHLYADMTNKDFFQRRTTDAKTGNTTWENAALVDAAINGKLVVLDGIDKLPFGMLSSLQQLLVDQNANLFDGTILKPPKEYEILKEKMKVIDRETGRVLFEPTDEDMAAQNIYPIHPAFRVVATARPPGVTTTQGKPFTISNDVTALFSIVTMPDATEETLEPVLQQVAARETAAMREEGFANAPAAHVSADVIHRLLRLRAELEELRLTDNKIPQLTFRQLLHLARGAVRYPSHVSMSIASSLLLPLMTGVTATQVSSALANCGFGSGKDVVEEVLALQKAPANTTDRIFAVDATPVLRFTRVYSQQELALVPFVTGFYPNKIHEAIISWLGKQYAMGSNILLIGNQGVGKNKVVDAFLARVQVPRHYIQLHRDTTVGSLTINPTVEGGKVRWEDSPLVKAVQLGHCLVVDEIDKASVEVVQVLKGLIEDHEMRLGDGRQIVEQAFFDYTKARGRDTSNMIAIHPDFRMIVLANPPGFPFHGNDFFRECGDLFSSYVMENPDFESQLKVLMAYAPNIPARVLTPLIAAFEKLQEAFREGNITYPFSLRELIAVVKHMHRYPQDGIYAALNNVFNFDARDDNTLRLVRQVLYHFVTQPMQRSGGMKSAFPFHAALPLPHKPLATLQPIPLPKAKGAKEFATVLNATILHDEHAVRAAVASGITATSCWKMNFPESAFTATARPHHDQSYASDWYTEWSGTQQMPFLSPQTDTVLAVTPVGRYGEEGASGSLVSFLVKRTPQGGNNSNAAAAQLLLATVHLPPTSMDSTAVTSVFSTLAARGWPVGEVHFVDLTPYVTAEDAADGSVALEDFCMAPHAALWQTAAENEAGWPPSASLSSVRRVVVADARDTNSPPVALLRDRTTKQMTLVDLMAGTVPELLVNAAAVTDGGVASSTLAPSPQDQKARTFTVANAVVTLPLQKLASPADAHTPLGVANADAMDGLITYVPKDKNTLYVLVKGQVAAITFPHVVEDAYFFSAEMAMVTLRDASAKQGLVRGVLKLVVRPAGVIASFARLPGGMNASIVDVVFDKDEEGGTAGSSDTLQPEDLLQSVWIEGQVDGSGLVRSTPASAKSDIEYMVVEDADRENLQFRMYPRPAEWTAKDAVATTYVDRQHHQLVHHHTYAGDNKHTNNNNNANRDGKGPSTAVVVMDTAENTQRTFAPLTSRTETFNLNSARGTGYAYSQETGQLSSADMNIERVQQRYKDWSTFLNGSAADVGIGASAESEDHVKDYKMEYSKSRYEPSGSLKHGQVDDKEHHGGNTWAGGTGGTDTAGLGGLVGPYRLDKGNPVHQVSDEDKNKVPKHIIEEAKRMGKEALQQRLAEIGMSENEYRSYKEFQERVSPSVTQLRTLLMGLKAAEGERTWLKGQTDGIWDDKKLVEGIVGDKNVYKRRVDSKDQNPFQQKYKKRVLFVLDVSASMYRFEGTDRRLTKLLESTIMIMEAFAGFEQKIDYAMVGHNGDSECIPLVDFGAPPANQRERLTICEKMVAYSQYCWSGDNTVEAMRHSIDLVTAQKGDSYFVFVVSDANLRRYGIQPSELSAIIKSKAEVQMFCIFIASLGAQASTLQKQLPAGHGYECMRTDTLPHVLRQIFTSVNLL